MALWRVMRKTASAAVAALLVAGCGGTLEGKYRRGQLTTTTTRATGGARSTVTTPTTVATTTTTTATPTKGNAAGQRAQENGTIVVSAIRRFVVPPLGGRHR